MTDKLKASVLRFNILFFFFFFVSNGQFRLFSGGNFPSGRIKPQQNEALLILIDLELSLTKEPNLCAVVMAR